MNRYTAGTTIRLSAEVRAAADSSLTDTSLTCSVLPPGGVTAVSVSVTRDSQGKYHADYTPTALGLHRYEFVGTSPAQVVAVGQFLVNAQAFA